MAQSRSLEATFAAAQQAFDSGDYAGALGLIEPGGRAIADLAPVLGLIGACHGALGDHKRAIRALTRAAAKAPNDPVVLYNLGGALLHDGRVDAAIAQHRRAVALAPHVAVFQAALGSALSVIGQPREAERSLRTALAIDPENVVALEALGRLYADLGEDQAALPLLEKAIAQQPANARLHLSYATVLSALRRPIEALAAAERAVAADPKNPLAIVDRAALRFDLCDWKNAEADLSQMRGLVQSESGALKPLFLINHVDDPALHLRASKAVARTVAPERAPTLPRRRATGKQKTKLLYVSADFRQHAVAVVIRGLLEHHDRDRFEVIAASIGAGGKSEMRERIRNSVDRFVDLGYPSCEQLVAELRALDADIAIDLMGHTFGHRLDAFAARVAPVQVSHIGFPGTTGIPAMDYLVADATLIPPGDEKFYTEQIIRLPRTYQPNDPARADAEGTATRADHSLPDDAFVFCCFNGARKFTPHVFGLWMDILKSVPRAILWLFGESEAVRDNLRREATARGVDAARVVFGEKLPYPQHLRRYALADCALDTFPYNGHLTSSDVVWMGLPLVGHAGRSFASRVSSSLLISVGAPELIARSAEEYVALAVRVAEDDSFRLAMRAKLTREKVLASLYDVRRYTRELEAAYALILDRHTRGMSPEHISVPFSP
jgi:predicted O-linked N-acetylglucosamine transferase (SPINDLY family)